MLLFNTSFDSFNDNDNNLCFLYVLVLCEFDECFVLFHEQKTVFIQIQYFYNI